MADEQTQLDDVVVYSEGLVALSACTAVDDKATTEAVNVLRPSGISSRWEIAPVATFRTGEPNGCPCDRYPGRRHLLFEC